MLKESEDNIAFEYEKIAEHTFNRNRMAIHLQEEDDFMESILQVNGTHEIEKILDYEGRPELIHRSDLIMITKPQQA